MKTSLSSKLFVIALVAVVAGVVAGATAAVAEDLTIVSTVTPSKGSPTTSTQYVTADKIRTSDGQSDSIVDVASGKIILIDHKKETYSEMSLQELAAKFAEVDQMLKETPALASILGQASEVTVNKAPGGRTIAGYECENYTMTMGQSFKFEICAAPALKPPIQYYDARKAFYATMGPMGSRFEKMFEEMKEIDGFPLYTKTDVQMMGVNMQTVSETTEVKKGSIPADVFTPPAGYKRTELK